MEIDKTRKDSRKEKGLDGEREEFKQSKIDEYFRLIRPQVNIQTKDIIKCIHVNINGLNAKNIKSFNFYSWSNRTY